MIGNVLLDTGPLIALIDRRDRHHAWAVAQFDQILPPLFTCEAVLTEACYLAPRAGRPGEDPLLLLERGVLRLAFNLSDNFGQVSALMRRYASVPMALADACLVRMSELVVDSVVMTLDSDFRIYRRHKRQKIPVLLPANA
ncbi:MAG: type II toxin-antitoxin system VapC family toxin [Isosphaeraceae bacterium]